ncbi:unnamed protein product [Paramecium pentaurelia]|uniref:Uncharacterized protein n=1 Tax=Paramecium pentaurelia TaxID=43138 RepID=A0A8S1WL89_9CILI|nr:unnamed protein product [Paramecium pentaurelia]
MNRKKTCMKFQFKQQHLMNEFSLRRLNCQKKVKFQMVVQHFLSLSILKNIKEIETRFIQNDFKKTIILLQQVSEHDFNKNDYSSDNYIVIRQTLIKKISKNQKIIKLLQFLVLLTTIDQKFIQCGSNSLSLLVEMKIDIKKLCLKNIRIKNSQTKQIENFKSQKNLMNLRKQKIIINMHKKNNDNNQSFQQKSHYYIIHQQNFIQL